MNVLQYIILQRKMHWSPKITNFKIESLKSSAVEDKLVFHPCEVSFNIDGVPSSVPNALRRTILSELPVWAFKPVHGDLETDDKHIIYDMVMRRFANLPIEQRDGEPIEFYASNTSPLIVDVKSDVRDAKTSKPVCNPNLTMFTLVPNTFLRIRLPRVLDYGYSFAGHTLASCAYSRVPEGILRGSVSTSAITSWEFGFTTNGNMEPHKIIELACDEIIRRVKSVAGARHDIHVAHVLTVPGESHTIGFLMQQFLNAISGVTATYQVSNVAREVTITVHTADFERCIADVIKHIVEIFESIKMLIAM